MELTRILLVLTLLHIQFCLSSLTGTTRVQSGESQQGQTYYSGSTSTSYTATTVDPSATSGVTSSSDASSISGANTGATGQQQAAYQPADFGVPAALQFPPIEPNAVLLRPGEYVPNCGCVARGACEREIGEYTRLVGEYSDVVCGFNFERCCFDGPCPGVLDEFVRAAPCVPQELCLRPYGVLPTDVRDFGIIAPCPGQGAVRCISVDNTQLLQFQAAVAAIEASQARYVPPPPQPIPEVIVPIVPIAPVAPPAPAPLPPPPPQPQQVVVPIVEERPSSYMSTFSSGCSSSDGGTGCPVSGQAIVTSSSTPNRELISNVATFLASNGIGTNPAPVAAVPPPPPPVLKDEIPVGQVTTTTLVTPPRYKFDCRSNGCYTPLAYRGGYPGYTYGFPGLGFSKSFHFSKGFNVFG